MSVAFVLSGGGAKGIYQVARMQRLEREGIRPNAIYGSSVGAINGAGYAWIGLEQLYHEWMAIEGNSDILSLQWWKLLTRQAKGVYSLKPLRENLLEKHTRIIESGIHVEVSCVKLDTGELKSIPLNYHTPKRQVDYIEASAAIPGAMEAVVMPNGTCWVDGGTREVVPIRAAIEAGHKTIYVFLTNPLTQNPLGRWDCKGKQEWEVLLRAIDGVMVHEVIWNDVMWAYDNLPDDVTMHLIAPRQLLPITTLDFDPELIRATYKVAMEE